MEQVTFSDVERQLIIDLTRAIDELAKTIQAATAETEKLTKIITKELEVKTAGHKMKITTIRTR